MCFGYSWLRVSLLFPYSLENHAQLGGGSVYSKNEEEHEEHLRLTLKLLREHQLYAKLSKCDFYRDRIEYLGHIILEEGISVDPEKIEAIMNCPTPRNVTDVRSFMGLVGYYRRFIEGFSKVAHAITSLQKKGIKFGMDIKM